MHFYPEILAMDSSSAKLFLAMSLAKSQCMRSKIHKTKAEERTIGTSSIFSFKSMNSEKSKLILPNTTKLDQQMTPNPNNCFSSSVDSTQSAPSEMYPKMPLPLIYHPLNQKIQISQLPIFSKKMD